MPLLFPCSYLSLSCRARLLTAREVCRQLFIAHHLSLHYIDFSFGKGDYHTARVARLQAQLVELKRAIWSRSRATAMKQIYRSYRSASMTIEMIPKNTGFYLHI